ncbi:MULTISPECIES: Na+/H+ antiporter NhaA [Sphingomonas]|uniref:Na+/H+ antiporter NhaA n=1 Tax=Sphingomonas TaxID=13687 RepID=UPI000F7FA82F|nr:Na+/H+ antiporter NhaA [Sphingomonas sp. ABOLF]RSV16099.1 Na+/H+ antiporter NhaA [Sphingomonas sp. ABOLF]RSV16124.1 Na+/H+ antiporter NhaA [Sphingomonas sp. ABOLF]GLK20217.1 Na(+)/H(+) antiporter NhaA [Microbacterium terregens]
MPDSPHHPRSALREFLKSEAGGGVLLIAAAALAMVVANLPGLSEPYFHLLHWTTGPVLSPKYGPMTVHLWINDGLMAIFFLLVGLEIKREFVDGRLATWQHRRLPVVAAAAGMVVPALVYLAVTGGRPELQGGWAVPAATDIAFAIGVLALLGSRAPASLKLFLTTVAIVDDMGAVAIIALAYTDGIASLALAAAGLVLAAMYVLNQSKVRSLTPYLLLGLALWYFVFLSGVHATIAGVATALMIPVKPTPAAPDAIDSPLHRLEHALHPWVAYAIVPLFGFANAGVSLAGTSAGVLLDPLPLGVALGLLLGKQIGIFGSIWIANRTGFAPRPGGASWVQIWGLSLLAGIGFTMSLFIGGLAFPNDPLLVDEVKIGVLAGSVLSALAGYAVLRLAPRKPLRVVPNRPSM